MSKHMQITVTINPEYKNDLAGTYPNLAHYLKQQDSSLADRNPSLYELAGQLDQLLYQFDGTPFREVLLKYSDDLRKLHKSIQENIADWNLARVDKLLYSIEDIFDAIETKLAL